MSRPNGVGNRFWHLSAAGEISFLGKPFKPSSPRASIKAGIAYVPEDRVAKGLFLDFDLYENIALVKSERDAI